MFGGTTFADLVTAATALAADYGVVILATFVIGLGTYFIRRSVKMGR